jgi:hypothetical protein
MLHTRWCFAVLLAVVLVPGFAQAHCLHGGTVTTHHQEWTPWACSIQCDPKPGCQTGDQCIGDGIDLSGTKEETWTITVTGEEQASFGGGVTWEVVKIDGSYTGSWSTGWTKSDKRTFSVTAKIDKGECGLIASRDHTYQRTDVETIHIHGTGNFDHECVHGYALCGHPAVTRTKVKVTVTPEFETHGCGWKQWCGQRRDDEDETTYQPDPLPTIYCPTCPTCWWH